MWTSDYEAGDEIVIPLKNGEGGYVADERTLDMLEGEGRVIARYLEVNPNGSRRDIAGIRNERGNVVGLMPHPEHAVERLTGPTTDGLPFFTSVLNSLVGAPHDRYRHPRREIPGAGAALRRARLETR